MIVIEGPDGSGKTTLIEQIRDYYPDLEVAPRVVSKQAEAMVDLQKWVDENLAQGPQYRIFDRHRLISEFIYGPILRKEQQPGFTSGAWVHGSLRRFYAMKPLIIYCLPPLEVVKKNLEGDNTNSVVWDHIDAMYTAYLQRASLDLIHAGAYVHDYTNTIDGQFDFHHPINRLYERVYK